MCAILRLVLYLKLDAAVNTANLSCLFFSPFLRFVYLSAKQLANEVPWPKS